jgi:hypothetical protein
LLAGGLLALADAAEQGGRVIGGELPVERPGGVVVAVHEGQQGIAEGAQAGEVVRGEDFLLDDGKDDLYLVEPGAWLPQLVGCLVCVPGWTGRPGGWSVLLRRKVHRYMQ